MAEFYNTTINTVRCGDTVAGINASGVAPVFNYATRSNNHIYVDDTDVTYVIDKQAETLKKEAVAYEKSKPKPKPKDPVKSILINPIKRVTTVVWNDGTITIVHCNNEKFDAEKGIAMCFMKKAFDNRGCFNDFLKKYMSDENWTKPKAKKEPAAKPKVNIIVDSSVNLDELAEAIDKHTKTLTSISTPKNIIDEDFWNSPISIPDVEGAPASVYEQPREKHMFQDLTEDDWKAIFEEDEDETK